MDNYGILNSINKKNRLHKLLLKTNVNSDRYAALKATFKQYRETLLRKKELEMPHEFVCNNNVITDMNVFANEFNRYYISIGHSLSEKIQSVHSSEEYLGQKGNPVFKFTAVNEDCIDTIIKKLKSKSSTGYDDISNKLIKHARTVLVKSLTLPANQIIHPGEFPRQLKIARLKPLFKKVMRQIIVPYLCYLPF